jgi:phosphoenolpyruvate-protein kinase (PTS system EI component)
MDFGADKFDDRVSVLREPNPVLGLRSVRLSFERQDLFRAQIRAPRSTDRYA